MLNESNISAKDRRSRSGPPSRLAATQEPDRNAVLKPAAAVSLALSPSHTAGITTKPGSASNARRRSGGFMTFPSERVVAGDDMLLPGSHQTWGRGEGPRRVESGPCPCGKTYIGMAW